MKTNSKLFCKRIGISQSPIIQTKENTMAKKAKKARKTVRKTAKRAKCKTTCGSKARKSKKRTASRK